jgi:hypothetical protein
LIPLKGLRFLFSSLSLFAIFSAQAMPGICGILLKRNFTPISRTVVLATETAPTQIRLGFNHKFQVLHVREPRGQKSSWAVILEGAIIGRSHNDILLEFKAMFSDLEILEMHTDYLAEIIIAHGLITVKFTGGSGNSIQDVAKVPTFSSIEARDAFQNAILPLLSPADLTLAGDYYRFEYFDSTEFLRRALRAASAAGRRATALFPAEVVP